MVSPKRKYYTRGFLQFSLVPLWYKEVIVYTMFQKCKSEAHCPLPGSPESNEPLGN